MGISPRMRRMRNCVGIIIDESENGFYGRVSNRYQDEMVEFHDLPELFGVIEKLLDSLKFPENMTKKRCFKNAEDLNPELNIDKERALIDTDQLLKGEDGYILLVTGREHATMQGILYDSRLDKDFHFDGDIELTRLLNK